MENTVSNKSVNRKFGASVKATYFSYVFSGVFRRPVTYIMPIAYILYLIAILLIVPKAMNNKPLFIWNLTTFNIPIFNLFFIGAIAAVLAVTIFRTSKDDGTELSLSVKPIKKIQKVLLKTTVYILVMLAICVATLIVVSLMKPIYGVYSTDNPNGIELIQYQGILLSMLLGNLITILFFSGLSILVSMVGGQAITMIVSIGLAFLFVILNFIYSNAIKTPADVISDKYGTSINCFATNTRKQYLEAKQNTTNVNYASIECHISESGIEKNHFDTYEYYNMAVDEAKNETFSYFDFGSQLSSIYKGFGLEETALNDAVKTKIGSNNSYRYNIDKSSHITEQTNLDSGNYPISIFYWNEYQGKYYPCVAVMGGAISSSLSSWYLQSTIHNLDFGAAVRLSSNNYSYIYPGTNIAKQLNNKLTYSLNDLYLTTTQQTEIQSLFDSYMAVSSYKADYLLNTLTTSSSQLWEGNYSDLDVSNKCLVNAKILTYFFVYGQYRQYELLKDYLDTTYPSEPAHEFPFSTVQVIDAYRNDSDFAHTTYMLSSAIRYGFSAGQVAGANIYCQSNIGVMPYCESFSNMYMYTVTSLYSTSALAAIWGCISLLLFAAAIVIYHKTDIK